MAGNTFGRYFAFTTFGESHGPAIGCVIDGVPANFNLHLEPIQAALNARRPGQSGVTSPRNEADQVEVLSGVFEGKTLGSPIMLLIKNQDARSQDYDALKSVFRPGHGDFVYQQKYGIRDHRGGGRASARETAARVAAGAVAAQILQQLFSINIECAVTQIGEIKAQQFQDASCHPLPFNFADSACEPQLNALFAALKEEGDSIGAEITAIATGVPVAWGEPIYRKLDSELAHAMMGINAAKAVSIGDGFEAIFQRGSESRDAMPASGFASNHAGGIVAGLSTGQPIAVRVAFKATSSVKAAIATQTVSGEATTLSVGGRHDPCVGIRAVPIVKAMFYCVLLDACLQRQSEKNISPS